VKLTIVVPAYNAASTIGSLLDSLAAQKWSQWWEVVVADNGSTDGTAAVAARYSACLPRLRVVSAAEHPSAAHARNSGAAAAQGEALAFCDADDEVGPGWLAAIGTALERYELVASRFDVAQLNPVWVQRSHGNPQGKGLSRYWYPPFLPHAGGGGLGVQRAVFVRLGGFDSEMPGLEDTDFCWRAQLAGVTLQFVPEAVYYVRHRHTVRGLWDQALSRAEQNVLLYRRYRRLGMPALTWQQSALAWGGLLGRLAQIRSTAQGVAWLWQLAWRLGRVRGSLRYRVWAV
jgi:glycosyltransferase involved in cell wall biosynthesis